MKAQNKVLALDFKSGKSTKDGANKDRPFVSMHLLDTSGNVFDVFKWSDDTSLPALPASLPIPCVLDCVFEIGQRNDNITFDILKIERKSALVDMATFIDKIPLEKVV